MNRRMHPTAAVGSALLLWTAVSGPATASAQATTNGAATTSPANAEVEAPTAAQLQVRVSDPGLASYGGAVERVLRSKLDELGPVRMSGTPALALDDLQLMVGCLGETTECLNAIAEQLSVEVMIMASVDLVDDERVLTVTRFDRRDASSRAATRRVTAREREHLVASLDGIVRELFDLPPAPEVAPDLDLVASPSRAAPPREGTLLPGLLVAGVGVAALGAGLGVGLAANAAGDEYRDAPTRSEAEVDAALALRTRASRRATTANALFVTGGVLTAAGVVLAIVLGRDPSDDRVRVDAAFGPGFAGLTVGGSL